MLTIPVVPGKCRLRIILNEKGWEQQYLASLMNMHEVQISAYVRGRKKMSLTTAKNIALVLGVSIDELYEWQEIE